MPFHIFLITIIFLSCAVEARAQGKSAPTIPPPSAVTEQQPMPTVYRNFIFGIGKEDVRKYETAVFYKDDGDSLYYLYQPDYFRRMIRYDFKDDKLVGIEHWYEELHLPNPYRIVEMSQEEELRLTRLYGDPTKQEFLWKDREYEKVIEAWGRALYMRDLQIRISWERPDARIVMQTYYDGNYYQIRYAITPLPAASSIPNMIDLGRAS